MNDIDWLNAIEKYKWMSDIDWLNAIEKYKWVIYYCCADNRWVVKTRTGPQFKINHKTLRAALHLAYMTQLAWEQKNEN